MALLVFVALLLLEAADRSVGQKAGFLSIDCGQPENVGSYTDGQAQLIYVPDGVPYVDAGEIHNVDADTQARWATNYHTLMTLRSFPSGVVGERNCYALPTDVGAKYLVRMEFLYGNYDKMNSSLLEFDLTLGVNHWATVSLNITDNNGGYKAREALFVAWARWAPACLVNTGGGTPFVSTVELRPLDNMPYPAVMGHQSMFLYDRTNVGGSGSRGEVLRYPSDAYDRFWWPWGPNFADYPYHVNSTQLSIQPNQFMVPQAVLQTAAVPVGNRTELTVQIQYSQDGTQGKYMVFLHLADFQDKKSRQFQAYLFDGQFDECIPQYKITTSYSSSNYWFDASNDGSYNLTLVATDSSDLPPMLNAYEVYGLINHDNPTTHTQDFDAIMAIKLEYGIKNKNWTGDPCFPPELAWKGVKCSVPNPIDNFTRIISLDLSNSNLNGTISNNFTLLKSLQYLNLSGNQLTGSIPASLCRNNGGSFDFSNNAHGLMCQSPSSNKTAILVASIVAPVLVVATLVTAYLIWRAKRKANISSHGPPRVVELMNDGRNMGNHCDNLQKTENRQFTYEELEKFTDNFKRIIGQGGFGHVYYGRLQDETEVAIKMRSESSSSGLHEFLAEVQCLTKVHHKNLVSLVGYCWEKDHLALVYEYMSRGNLCDHLKGKMGVGDTLEWATRVRVVLGAAQGLDYLHKGCNLPIIHGDVKTNNILLSHKLNAKISDFGLSKTYHSDTQSHISTIAAGSIGYIDPEYYTTGRLTESSDVYSFGIVLLEVVTGEPPIIPGHGHIIERVKQKIITGNISSVGDMRLRGAYNVNSMWKVVDIAMMCTVDIAAQRPTMASVVLWLKESLALEEGHEDNGGMENIAIDAMSSMSTFAPSPR